MRSALPVTATAKDLAAYETIDATSCNAEERGELVRLLRY